MKMTHDTFEQLDLNELDIIVGGRSLTPPPSPLGVSVANAQAGSHPAAAETDAHGLTFLGGIATASAGITIGPFIVGGSLATGGPNHDLYGSFPWGVQEPDEDAHGFSVTGGIQAGGVFGYPGASYDDVVTGHSTGLGLGIASIAANDHGFIAQVGSAGFGVSESDTVNLTTDHSFDSVINVGDGKDHSAEMSSPPTLNDWSGAFGDHELNTGDGVDAASDHSPDPNVSGDHGPQDHGGEELGDPGNSGLAHDDQSSHGGNDSDGNELDGIDFSGNDLGGSDPDGGYFGNDFGDSNFGGGDFGGSDFA